MAHLTHAHDAVVPGWQREHSAERAWMHRVEVCCTFVHVHVMFVHVLVMFACVFVHLRA